MKTNYFSRIEIIRAENGVIVAQSSGLSQPNVKYQSPEPPTNDHVFTDIEELFEFLKKKIVMPDMPQPAPTVVPGQL